MQTGGIAGHSRSCWATQQCRTRSANLPCVPGNSCAHLPPREALGERCASLQQSTAAMLSTGISHAALLLTLAAASVRMVGGVQQNAVHDAPVVREGACPEAQR